VAKEWKNTVYTFNKNNIINFSINDISINSLIQHYFNLRFIPKFLKKKYKPRWVRRPSMNKIYVSSPEIKHTNSKAIITIYTYNREKISLKKKILNLKRKFFQKIKFLIFNSKIKGKNILKFNKYNKYLRSYIKVIRRYKLRLNLNSYKFEEKLLYQLSNIIGLYYNKRIEFNVVNMKSIILNSDIFTKILGHKLWKKKIFLIRMMKYILNKALLPRTDTIKDKNKILQNLNYNTMSNKNNNLHIIPELENKDFNSMLSTLYYNILSNNKDKNYANIYNIIFNGIKYKNMRGVRLEVKGRLSKRNRADRALFKVKWKGGLKNIYSSYLGLSSVKKRGYLNSNVEYSIFTSKRRIGAFAVKGWVSGK